MSAPRLLLLTGPAAGEVAQAISEWKCLGCDLQAEHTCIGFEVRDYGQASTSIAQTAFGHSLARGEPVDAAIRSLPGGEAWLVGLVLPAQEDYGALCCHGNEMQWDCLHCRTAWPHEPLPARLAILAPEPPPLLVERVGAWEGEVWECVGVAQDNYDQTCYCIQVKGFRYYGDEWPEAVRAALGEVAPC